MTIIKEADLLAGDLEVIAETLPSNYCREVLKRSAELLRELAGHDDRLKQNGRKEKCKTTCQKR
jgi:hypothetical protein